MKLDPLKILLSPAAIALIIVSASILAVLVYESLNTWIQDGIGFLLRLEWSPSEETYGTYGMLAPFLGSLVTAVIAMTVAGALSTALAVFVNEYAPKRFNNFISLALFSMAALPTIVYGMWGLSVFAPAVRQSGLASLCAMGSPTGYSVFTAGVVVGLMIAPFSAAMVLEAYRAVPFTYVEALHSLGAKGFERAGVILGLIKGSIIASALLSFGRAIGETTIVAMTVGNVINLPLCPFQPAHTITSLIASQFGNAYLYPGLQSRLLAGALVMVIGSSVSTSLGMWLARVTARRLKGESL
ncbi:MAG: ABC transporter permease subunit [Thermofilaceae archaeon]|nr:ABC transporter permease subunit [Thermofilaceae archaeon]MCX8179795.1 ABC transporter permease subunit [Thermofilaceae archaeon]MDW8004322.1 ABC transporter permease subunit [Thermofilaceae archaeon]